MVYSVPCKASVDVMGAAMTLQWLAAGSGVAEERAGHLGAAGQPVSCAGACP